MQRRVIRQFWEAAGLVEPGLVVFEMWGEDRLKLGQRRRDDARGNFAKSQLIFVSNAAAGVAFPDFSPAGTRVRAEDGSLAPND